jgi:hypothetical protein
VDVLNDALNTIRTKNLAADSLLFYLERKVRVGEVLNELASNWSDTTKGDFADAFQMDRSRLDTMDAIVSLAILNNPQLDEEIRAENTPDPSQQELLDNRVIAAQWPSAGSQISPPYLFLVAVEYRSAAQADDIVRAITGDLVDYQGMKLPRSAVQKLRG